MRSTFSYTAFSSTESSSTSASSSHFRASRSTSAPFLICSSMVLLRSTITSFLSMLASWSASSTTPTRARPASARSPSVSSACSSRRSDWKRSADSRSSYSFKHISTRLLISESCCCPLRSTAAAAFPRSVSMDRAQPTQPTQPWVASRSFARTLNSRPRRDKHRRRLHVIGNKYRGPGPGLMTFFLMGFPASSSFPEAWKKGGVTTIHPPTPPRPHHPGFHKWDLTTGISVSWSVRSTPARVARPA